MGWTDAALCRPPERPQYDDSPFLESKLIIPPRPARAAGVLRDRLRLRGVPAEHHVRPRPPPQRHPSQLRPLQHRDLQPARQHGLVGELHVAAHPEGDPGALPGGRRLQGPRGFNDFRGPLPWHLQVCGGPLLLR